ncbi:39S ribosomal protein L50, mitochondrial [Pipistrellus kuhlii]|uniref:Large ribosomal subunit protein mL50 n=1 Tax=Pipistrellus kuhlii TaxID=59472 RepID=A0A7J7W3I0_PIPKU|nr:39S ribosomal protein L50, mitochondrial [Pipistrellus kuhlii]KAF6331942.1 mitochondrial ribosomal protein L50 [Pipistrellus kuhlii]
MAAALVPGVSRKGLTWMIAGVPRQEFWSRFREQKKPVVAETVEEVKKEPLLACPPLRSRTYAPPEDLQSRLESSVKDIFGSSAASSWQDISLDDGRLKFSLLTRLADDLGHAVPNSRLHEMCRVRDVLEFYKVPVQDRSKFDELVASNLPPNIKITWGY